MKNRLKSRDVVPGVRFTSTHHEWVDKSHPAWVDDFRPPNDELVPMRGIVNGLLIVIPFWVVIILLIVWWFHG